MSPRCFQSKVLLHELLDPEQGLFCAQTGVNPGLLSHLMGTLRDPGGCHIFPQATWNGVNDREKEAGSA